MLFVNNIIISNNIKTASYFLALLKNNCSIRLNSYILFSSYSTIPVQCNAAERAEFECAIKTNKKRKEESSYKLISFIIEMLISLLTFRLQYSNLSTKD